MALSACFPQHVDPRGNGDTGALDFDIQNRGGDRVILATGFQAEIGITRTDGQWQNCVISKNVPAPTSAPTPNAGTLTPKDSCSSLHTEPIQLIDASCDDDACTITPENLGGGIVALLITGTRDGDATLHVNVKSTGSSATWGDSYPLTFATPTKVTVAKQAVEGFAPGFAYLPGASFNWCPDLRDGDGNVLTEIPSSITNVIGGVGVSLIPPPDYAAPTNCVAFSSSRPGKSSVTFDAQALTASESLLVANPSDIVAVELRAYVDSTGTSSADGGAQSDGGADAGAARPSGDEPDLEIAAVPTTSISLTADDFEGVSLASVLTLKDGTHALGGAGYYQSDAKQVISIWSNDADPELARTGLTVTAISNVIGDGHISASINGIAISVPFHIAAAPPESDGGF